MVGNIHWPNRDSAPPDMPKCGFNNEKCDNSEWNSLSLVSMTFVDVILDFIILILKLFSF